MKNSPSRLLLRQLYATKRGAKLVLDYAATVMGVSSGTAMTVDSLWRALKGPKGPQMSRCELITTLRAFTQAGCGRFMVGRHGQPSRFIWGAAPTAFLAALRPASPSPSGDTGIFGHAFRLRPGLVLALNLPADLTPSEAERLARFVQTLPIRAEANLTPAT